MPRKKRQILSANGNLNSEDLARLTCKTCFEISPNIRQALRHDLTHLKISEGPDNTPQHGGRFKKRNKRKKAATQETANEIQSELKAIVTSALNSCPPDAEITTLCGIFQPDINELQGAFRNINADLYMAFAHTYNIEVFLFGSTITGMAFKSSDIDLFIKVHNADGMNCRKVYNDFLQMLRRSGDFSQIVPVPAARVPVIKCFHKASGYHVDLNITSEGGVYTSRFIAQVLYTDSRIHALMILLKIWGKSWDIVRFGGMTNYCLALLIFFFLQKIDRPLLPSVKKMKEGAPNIVVDFIDYGVELRKFRSKNKDSVRELLCKFFKFYSEYEFQSNVICPYLATSISRKEFESNSVNFPEYHDQVVYIKQVLAKYANASLQFNADPLNCTTPMVLQDAFRLNQNKAKSVGQKSFIKFKKHLMYGSKICEEGAENNQSFGKVLQRLFYEQPNIPDSSVCEKSTNAFDKDKMFICRLNPIECELFWVRMYLRKEYPSVSFDKYEVNKTWVEKIISYTMEILKKIYKIQMSPVPKDDMISKTQKKEGHTDVHSNKYVIDCILTSSIDLWSGRKFDSKVTYSTLIDEQIKITEKLETDRKSQPPVKLNCRLTVYPENNFSTIEFTMKDMLPSKEKSQAKIFFQEFTARTRCFFRAFFEAMTKEESNNK